MVAKLSLYLKTVNIRCISLKQQQQQRQNAYLEDALCLPHGALQVQAPHLIMSKEKKHPECKKLTFEKGISNAD